MACIGEQACRDASVTLAGDLFVGGTDGSISGTNPFAGRLANFNFTTGGSHCVQTLGAINSQEPLREASLTFEQPSNVRMLCEQGAEPCRDVKVRLPSGSCFHVNCTLESCENFAVLPLVDGETDFRCYCSGGDACAWTAQLQFSYCEDTTADPCGSYETEVLATQQSMGSTRKVPVDFEIFTHYAGHASFTKGLGSDCQRLSLASLEHLHLASCGVSALETRNMTSDGIQFGAFDLAKSKKRGLQKLTLLINDGIGLRTLAQLWVSCRPGHQLSAKIKMSSQKDLRFVRGELAPGRLSLAAGLEGKGEVNKMTTDAEPFASTVSDIFVVTAGQRRIMK
eukprot:s299_g1.t1